MKIPSVPVSYESITYMIQERIVELLTAYCQTSLDDISEAQKYRAGLVRMGNLQADPTKTRISLTVHPSNPDDMASIPKTADRPGQNIGGFDFMNSNDSRTAYEIGGGEYWERTFTVDIDIYLMKTKEVRDEATQIGLWVFGRAQQAIRENGALGLKDDFKESAHYMVVVNVNPYEAGGPPKDFEWRGKLAIRAYTSTTD